MNVPARARALHVHRLGERAGPAPNGCRRASTDIRMPRRLDALRVPRLCLLRACAAAASAAWAECMRAVGKGGAPWACALA